MGFILKSNGKGIPFSLLFPEKLGSINYKKKVKKGKNKKGNSRNITYKFEIRFAIHIDDRNERES